MSKVKWLDAAFLLRVVYLPVCVAILLSGCRRNEFDVDIQLPETVNATYRVVYYASDSRGGVSVETAMAVSKGKGKLEGICLNPQVVMVFEGSSATPSAIFFVTRGDHIKIRGDGPSPSNWEISGNRESEEMSAWRIKNASVIISGVGKDINMLLQKLASESPEKRSTAILLTTMYDSRAEGPGLVELLKKLTEEAAETDVAAMLGRIETVDIDERNIRGTDAGDMLVVQGEPTGADTIWFRKGKPVFLLCRGFQARGDSEAVDSLKALVKAFPGLKDKNFAELYFTADTISWLSSLRRDTINGALRARMPRELAEPDMIRLGVKTLVWCVVIDGRGKISYSGNDIGAATSTFRKLMKSPRSVKKKSGKTETEK